MLFKVALLLLVSVIMANALTEREKFNEFKTKFNKSYESPEEEERRFQIFVENSRKIDEHNEKYAKGEVTYSQGINQFADQTPDEFKKNNLGLLNINRKQD